MSSRHITPLILVCVVLLAGCGGNAAEQRLARADAASLIALADRISREGPCAQARDIRALNARRSVLIAAHRIPARLEAPLSAGVQALVVETPACLPPLPAVAATSPPVADDKNRRRQEDDHGHGHHHGHGHGHGGDD